MHDHHPIVLILHGIGGHAGIHWQQWLHDQLVQHGYTVIMPNLSAANHPDRQQWLTEVKQAVQGVDTTQLVVVGHSLGVTSALDFVEQSTTPVKGLVSVSGFAIDYGAELNGYFCARKTSTLRQWQPNLIRLPFFTAMTIHTSPKKRLSNWLTGYKQAPLLSLAADTSIPNVVLLLSRRS